MSAVGLMRQDKENEMNINQHNNRLVREVAKSKKAHRHHSARNPHRAGRIALLLCELQAQLEEEGN